MRNKKKQSREYGRWIKIVIFSVLLIGAGYFFGTVCGQINQVYNLILAPSVEILYQFLWFLLAVLIIAVVAGLASALLRPVWIGIIAFAFSGAAMLLGWQITTTSSILAVLYFLAGVIYMFVVSSKLNQLIKFSVQPVVKSQGILRIILILMACASLYLGYMSHIEKNGFSVPEQYFEILIGQVEKQVKAQVSEKEYKKIMPGLREELRGAIDKFSKGTIGPYGRFIPLIIAICLFMPLVTIVQLLSWIPAIFLCVIFPLLERLGVLKTVSETGEIQRLVIG